MVQKVFRRALGAVKDQASIGLAKVSINKSRFPALEIAIVKATSHDEFVQVGDKHVREIVEILSFSKGYAALCVALLAKRLNKTKNWVVALKVLLLIHKLLLQDSSVMDSSFDDEMLLASRRVLNFSSFRDESKHPLARECSQFVKNYALYIGNWLDCFVLGAEEDSPILRNSLLHQIPILIDYDDYRMDYSSFNRIMDEEESVKNITSSSVGAEDGSDPKTGMLLNRVPILQHLLEHVLGCSSATRIPHGLVRSALTQVVRDSFRVYTDICDGMSSLLNEFFLMIHRDGLKTLAVYGLLAKQADALAHLYQQCQDLGLCVATEYPAVQQVSREHLVLLDDYLKDAVRNGGQASNAGGSPALQEAERINGDAGTGEKITGNAGAAEEIRMDAGRMNRKTENAENNSSNSEVNSSKVACEEWEAELMKEAEKLSHSLSMGRGASFSLSNASSLIFCTPPRNFRKNRAPLFSLSAIPAFSVSSTSNGESLLCRGFSSRETTARDFYFKDGGKIGIGSPGSYGLLMNKHPLGYRHLLLRRNT